MDGIGSTSTNEQQKDLKSYDMSKESNELYGRIAGITGKDRIREDPKVKTSKKAPPIKGELAWLKITWIMSKSFYN